MDALLKVVFPVLLAIIIIIGFYRLYGLLNNKITGSHTLSGILFYAFILFVSCLTLFIGGLFVQLQIYVFLTR